MTSAWKERLGRDDRADGQDAKLDENQLEMFEAARRPRAETLLQPEAPVHGSSRHESGEPRYVEMVVTEVSTHDFLDMGRTDSDELHRLEESIRWLMNEGSVRRLPRAATLPPVRGLTPVEPYEDDSLLLDPDILFVPRSSRRRGSLARGAAKILLVSTVAAPMAYLVANWTQFSGTAAPSDSASISDPMSPLATTLRSVEERVAAVAPPRHRPPEAGQNSDDTTRNPEPESTVMRATPPVEMRPSVSADVGAAHYNGGPEQAPSVSATPSDPAPVANGPGLAQSGSTPQSLATPPQSPDASATPSDTVPGPRVAGVAESSGAPAPGVAAPRVPGPRAPEIAALVERGSAMFDAGDVAAARLFFRRAANAGDAQAALLMGYTYDPDVLANRFVRGIEADPQEARKWYERARELGSPEGPRRIEQLAHR
jgi:hypothetical protein